MRKIDMGEGNNYEGNSSTTARVVVSLPKDHERRISFLRKALTSPSVVFKIYPGEFQPHELHAYVKDSDTESLIFACVLAPSAVIKELMLQSDSDALTLQAIEDNEAAAVISGLQEWIRRVLPQIKIPEITVNFYDGPV